MYKLALSSEVLSDEMGLDEMLLDSQGEEVSPIQLIGSVLLVHCSVTIAESLEHISLSKIKLTNK